MNQLSPWHARPTYQGYSSPQLIGRHCSATPLYIWNPTESIGLMSTSRFTPGVTIPIHHNTGEWVNYSHHIHVPIIVPNPDKVLFLCGPTANTWERINCTPGYVFGMNKQANHAVTSPFGIGLCQPLLLPNPGHAEFSRTTYHPWSRGGHHPNTTFQ